MGLDDVLVFHAYDVDALVNKAADGNGNDGAAQARLERVRCARDDYTGLDIDAALGELNGTSLGDLTRGVDLAVGGGVALNVLSGVLVAKGDFTIALGQLRSAALPSGAAQDADVMTLTLTNVGVFVGVGGSCWTTTVARRRRRTTRRHGAERHARVWGDGGTLTLVSIKDRGASAC